jgi:hypothetical protein
MWLLTQKCELGGDTMLWEFIKRAYGPQLALLLIFAGVSWTTRLPANGPCIVLYILVVFMPGLCWYMSDVLTTGRKTACLLAGDLSFQVVLFGGMGVVLLLLMARNIEEVEKPGWKQAVIAFFVVDLLVFTFVLINQSGYAIFVEHFGEEVRAELAAKQKLRTENRKRSQARREALRYYNRHADLLAEECPPSLFRAHLSSATGDHLPVDQVWKAMRELLGRLEVHCQEGRRQQAERKVQRAQEEKRRKEIDRAIAALEGRIAHLQKGTVIDDEEFAEREILACEHEIRELREQKDMLDTLS